MLFVVDLAVAPLRPDALVDFLERCNYKWILKNSASFGTTANRGLVFHVGSLTFRGSLRVRLTHSGE